MTPAFFKRADAIPGCIDDVDAASDGAGDAGSESDVLAFEVCAPAGGGGACDASDMVADAVPE